MDDLISRQDAINEFSYCQTYLFDSIDRDPKISLEDAKYAIEQLPSAPQWIPCSERLPEEFKRVLCCTDKKEMFLACVYIFDNGYTFDDEEGMMWEGDVVAWMPLPEQYRGKNDE